MIYDLLGLQMIVWSGATFILSWFCSPLKKNEILIFQYGTKPRGGLCITLVFVMTYEELWIFASMKTFSHWSLLSFPSDSLLTWINWCADCCSLGMKSDLSNVTSSVMIVTYWNAHRSKKLPFYLCTSLLPLFLFVHQEPTHRIDWNMITSHLKNWSTHSQTTDWNIHSLCFFGTAPTSTIID